MSDSDSESQPFRNIKVVEFGQFVAVPFCGQLLAEGGAEVIKVESPDGDPNRHMGEVAPLESRIFISRNRGKHSLPLKLSEEKAQPVIKSLLAWADVVLMNFRPGLAANMGIDPETLREIPQDAEDMSKGIEFLDEKLKEATKEVEKAKLLVLIGSFCRILNSLERSEKSF